MLFGSLIDYLHDYGISVLQQIHNFDLFLSFGAYWLSTEDLDLGGAGSLNGIHTFLLWIFWVYICHQMLIKLLGLSVLPLDRLRRSLLMTLLWKNC